MQQQAEHFGARLVYDEVTEVDFRNGPPFTVKTYGETYEDCVDKWRTAAAAAKPKITDDAALAAVLRDVAYAWCINRMYTAAGTLPPEKPKAKKPAAKQSKPRSR